MSGLFDPQTITEEQVQRQLVKLGFTDVAPDQLKEFTKDLKKLIRHESRQKSSSSCQVSGDHVISEISRDTSYLDLEDRVPSSYQRRESEGTQTTTAFSQISEHDHPKLTSSDGSTWTTEKTSLGRRIAPIRRRIMRYVNGEPVISDESTSATSDSGLSVIQDSSDFSSGNISSRSDSVTYRKTETSVVTRKRRVASAGNTPRRQSVQKQKQQFSVLRPATCETVGLRSKTHDAVARHHWYEKKWAKVNLPGDEQHYDVRVATRKKMATLDFPPRPLPKPLHSPNVSLIRRGANKEWFLGWQI